MTTAALATTDTKSVTPDTDNSAFAEGVILTRFGMVPATKDQQVRFKDGLPGFPGVECFQIERVPHVDGDLMLLQATEHVDIAFFVLPLDRSSSIIQAKDITATCEQLGIPEEDLMMLTVVNLQRENETLAKYVNLRAPIFIDVNKQTGAQVVLGNSSYPLRLKLAE